MAVRHFPSKVSGITFYGPPEAATAFCKTCRRPGAPSALYGGLQLPEEPPEDVAEDLQHGRHQPAEEEEHGGHDHEPCPRAKEDDEGHEQAQHR